MGLFDWLADVFGSKEEGRAMPPPAPLSLPDAPPITVDYEDERIPDNCRPLIAQIRFLITDIEQRAAAQPLFCDKILELKQMRDQHLPKMLLSYFDIPAQHRAEIFRRTGKSASYMLNQSLTTMAERLDQMSKSMAKNNIDTFDQNMRFIEVRYGEGYSPVD